jgi:hypothetical protein
MSATLGAEAQRRRALGQLDQLVHDDVGIGAAALEDRLGDDQRLLGVVRVQALLAPARGVVRRRLAVVLDAAEALVNLLARHSLGRPAQGVAHGQAHQGPGETFCQRQGSTSFSRGAGTPAR